MLDQVMFFCVSLILSAGIETWILDTLHNHWIFNDDLVEKINFYTAIGMCILTVVFCVQHIVTYFMIRGKNFLEMVRVDAEWIVSGCDDSFNIYKTPEDVFEVSENNLVIAPKSETIESISRSIYA